MTTLDTKGIKICVVMLFTNPIIISLLKKHYWFQFQCFVLWLLYNICTDSTKINCPDHNIHMYWTNFWHPKTHVQQNIFGKNLIKVGSSHLYASFGTFCSQIGHLFEGQWVFWLCLKIDKSLLSKQNVDDFGILRMFKDSLWRKWLTNLDAKGAKRSVKM